MGKYQKVFNVTKTIDVFAKLSTVCGSAIATVHMFKGVDERTLRSGRRTWLFGVAVDTLCTMTIAMLSEKVTKEMEEELSKAASEAVDESLKSDAE